MYNRPDNSFIRFWTKVAMAYKLDADVKVLNPRHG